ncbi:MAG TPA: CoA pyrophosphatase [Polyangiaceae bacterium]
MPVPFSIDDLRRRLAVSSPVALSARQRASVALILGQLDEQLQLLLIRRAEHPEDPWSGHMALPGGRRDELDADDLATAIRESMEEVGLDLRRGAQLLGQLDDIVATAGGRAVDMVITPFVFSVETLTEGITSAEATACFWTPLLPLYNGRAATSLTVDMPDGRRALPAWKVEGNLVWGLTYRMINNLLSMMRSGASDAVACP